MGAVSTMSTCRTAATKVVLMLLVACSRPETQFPNYSPASGNPALLEPDDIAVYEAVISAYAAVGQILMLRLAPGPPPGSPISGDGLERLTAQHQVRMRPYTSRGFDVTPQADRWRALDGQNLPPVVVPDSVVADFSARNRHRASLKAFRPKHLRIEWTEKMETMNCLYTLTLPGYSRSHDEAIVEISCGMWALAGGGELLYLKRTGNSWRVIAKQPTWIS
jgi:hypothetical protein